MLNIWQQSRLPWHFASLTLLPNHSSPYWCTLFWVLLWLSIPCRLPNLVEGNNFFQPSKQMSGYILFTVRFSSSSKMDFCSADNEITQSCSYSIYFLYAHNRFRHDIEHSESGIGTASLRLFTSLCLLSSWCLTFDSKADSHSHDNFCLTRPPSESLPSSMVYSIVSTPLASISESGIGTASLRLFTSLCLLSSWCLTFDSKADSHSHDNFCLTRPPSESLPSSMVYSIVSTPLASISESGIGTASLRLFTSLCLLSSWCLTFDSKADSHSHDNFCLTRPPSESLPSSMVYSIVSTPLASISESGIGTASLRLFTSLCLLSSWCLNIWQQSRLPFPWQFLPHSPSFWITSILNGVLYCKYSFGFNFWKWYWYCQPQTIYQPVLIV